MNGEIRRKGASCWLIGLLGLVLAVVVLAVVVMTPWNINKLASNPQPATSYEQAVQRIDTLRAQDAPGMNPDCQAQLLTHGQKVEQAIVLVHGYTNCPKQFATLGQRFYDQGYNVLLMPMPRHGLADLMNEVQAQLKAEELAAYANQTVDIAQGLGERVTVMGISMGGVVAAWAAQNRPDIDTAVIISPMFGLNQIPAPLTAAAVNLFSVLPNSFDWWDPVLQANLPAHHVYPRYSTRALSQGIRLGLAVQSLAKRVKPAARKIVVVTNGNDTSVNNELTNQVVNTWQAHGANLSTYEFDAGLKLPHDLIDPTTPDLPIDLIYTRLIELSGQ